MMLLGRHEHTHCSLSVCVDYYLDITDGELDSLETRLKSTVDPARVIVLFVHPTTAMHFFEKMKLWSSNSNGVIFQIIWAGGASGTFIDYSFLCLCFIR